MSTLVAWAIEGLIASALLLALVLAIRAPVRRMFGPQVAYALWALPLLRLVLPPLPAAWQQATTPIMRAGETITLIVAPVATTSVTSGDTLAQVPWVAIGICVWLMVAVGFLGWQVLRHRRFCREVVAGSATIDRIARVRIVESDVVPGPLAFGIVRPVVAFPRDFDERYDADERALALAHELSHHARGDLIANWAALVVLALHWFNPLAWRAFSAFRADQELANDARVLAGRSAYDRHAYATAIVKAAHGGALSAACHLHSIHDLKGRLSMLRTQTSHRRIAAGGASIVVLAVAALGLTASGTRAAETVRSRVASATDVAFAPLTEPDVPDVAEPASGAKRDSRVVIIRDGQTTTYEGAEAEAYIAANPVPVPPVPPVPPGPDNISIPPIPPVPPVPPVPAEPRAEARAAQVAAMAALRNMPDIASTTCGSGARRGGGREDMVITSTREGRRSIVICTDRIARQAERGAQLAMNSSRIQRDAMRQAAEGLRQARAAMEADRTLSDEARREARAAIDESITEIERERQDD